MKTIETLAARAHHFVYAAAFVAVAFIVAYFFGPVRTVATMPAVTTTQTRLDRVASSVERVKRTVDALAAVRAGAVSTFARPAINVVAPAVGRFLTPAEVSQILAGLGRQRTIPAYRLVVSAPTPRPPPALPAGMTADQAAFTYRMTYNATSAALKNTTLHFDVTQEPAPPSRVKSAYGLDKSAGIAVAVARRGAFDLDVGATEGNVGTEPFVGVEWRLRGSSVGVLGGVALRRGRLGGFVAVPVSLP